jgi:hypothetical protein
MFYKSFFEYFLKHLKFLDLLHFHSLLKPMLDFYECQRLKAFPLKPACSINHPAGTFTSVSETS